MTAETYLGDGVYASFDGWQIMLRTPRDDSDHYIALEPEVLKALMAYAALAGRRSPHSRPDSRAGENMADRSARESMR